MVPEFKDMLEEVAEIGTSGAKKYIKHLENQITKLESTKEEYKSNGKYLWCFTR